MSTSEIAKLESRWRENPNGLTFAPLAEAYRKQKDPQRALEILGPGLEKHPDYIPANIVLGRCHWDLNDLPAAETAFSHVLGLDEENVIALKALADISERLVRYEEAERWLESLLAVDRSNDEARHQLARIRELQQEQAEGSAAVPGAAEVAPEEASAVPQVELAEPERPVIEEPAPHPAAFESAPEPPTPDEAGPVEYIGWVARPEETAATEHLKLDDLEETIQPAESSKAADTPPLPGLETAEPAAPHSTLLDPDSFGIEHREEIVLNATGHTEYQTPSAADDLMAEVTGTPRLSMDDLRRDLAPPEPITSALNDVNDLDLDQPAPPEVPDVTPLADALDAADAVDANALAEAAESRPVDFYALDEPAAPAAVEPPIPEPPAVAPPAPPPSLGAMEEMGDAPAVAEPELVVTETMAEVFLRQGHVAEALTVYRELLRRSPGASRLATRVAELEARQAAAAPPPRPAYAARETGGQSVASLFQALLSTRPGDAPGRWPPRSEPAAPPTPPESASATRPAGEPLSLGSVFGEEPPPVAPAVRNDPPPAAAGQGSVSFDDFFGTPRSAAPGAPPPSARATTARRGDDLEQFHAWLQSLKR